MFDGFALTIDNDEKNNAARRIVEDIRPYIIDSNEIMKEYRILTTNPSKLQNLGRFMFDQELGGLDWRVLKNRDETRNCLRSHKEDFKILGIDIEEHLT